MCHAMPTAGCTSTSAGRRAAPPRGSILPEYVEKALADLPEVNDVCVYGIPASTGAPGESGIVLAVVPRAGTSFDPAALIAHLEAHLEPNFVPSLLQVVDEIPKTISEKPQVRFLQERLGAAGAVVHRGRSAHGA